MCELSRMAETKYHKLGNLKQQKCLEVQHQGINRVFVHTGPGKSPGTENLAPRAEGRERLKKEAEATPAWHLTECTCEGKLTLRRVLGKMKWISSMPLGICQ